MTRDASFVTNSLPSPKPRSKFPQRRCRKRPIFATANVPETSIKRPDAGLITKSSVTGTLCANLWPIPILGAYSWFLNVYDRNTAASVGPFVITSTVKGLHLEFQPGQRPSAKNVGESHRGFRGIATGNINVRKAVDAIAQDGEYQLKLFEKGGSENFLQRRNEVHVGKFEKADVEEMDIWSDPAPTYRTISRASNYEVREVYAGGGALPRATAPLEYFAMNLFPILLFKKYSCFVCVWKQRTGLSPVAIDKLGQSLRLSFFDPLEISEDQSQDDTPPVIARFAVKVFFGAVMDDTATTQHKMLLDSIASSPSTRALSNTDFRLVVDNTPGTVTPNRRNQMWVQVE